MRLLLCCLFFLTMPLFTLGQNFLYPFPADSYSSSDTNSLFLSIENTNFLKNNEYFNDYVDGYTKLGFFLRPELTYLLSEGTTLSAGAHMLKYSGSDRFHQVIPVFSLEHKLYSNLGLVMGTLDNRDHHHLIDPVYHFENFLDRNVENGLQLLADYGSFRGDLWINWERFIFQGADFREQFETGVSADARLLGKESRLSLNLPFQLLVQHKGGQINQSDKPISTIINASTGLNTKMETDAGLIRSLTLRNQYVMYRDVSPQKLQPYSTGYAWYTSLIMEHPAISLELSYWRAHQFISFSGNPIFQAYSIKKNRSLHPNRELFAGRLRYSKTYDHLRVLFNVDSYFDPLNHSMDFGIGLYLMLNTELFLAKSKARD